MPVPVSSPSTRPYTLAQQTRVDLPTPLPLTSTGAGQLYTGAVAELAGVGVDAARAAVKAAIRS